MSANHDYETLIHRETSFSGIAESSLGKKTLPNHGKASRDIEANGQ